jgi:arylsulfatase
MPFGAALQVSYRKFSSKRIGAFNLHTFATPFVLLALTAVAVEDARPNILLIMADDMGFSDISSYGSEVPTPHLDQLAANGITFSQFYNNGRCSPTRASLLTGMYAHQVGITEQTGITAWDSGTPNVFAIQEEANCDDDGDGDTGPSISGTEVEEGVQSLSLNVPTLAEALSDAGYYTAISGKWHLNKLYDLDDRAAAPWNRGFDRR